jgi:hypothetical protein
MIAILPVAYCLFKLERFYVGNIINTSAIFWRMIDCVVKCTDLFDGNEVLLPALLTGSRNNRAGVAWLYTVSYILPIL